MGIDELLLILGRNRMGNCCLDCAYFATKYGGQDKVKAKALDDRVGCALIEILKENYEFLCCVFTVQEEVGLGASSGYQFPGIGPRRDNRFDVPGPHLHATSVGKGLVFTVMDRTIPHPSLVRELIDLAEQHSIAPDTAHQHRRNRCADSAHRGGTSCGAHLAATFTLLLS